MQLTTFPLAYLPDTKTDGVLYCTSVLNFIQNEYISSPLSTQHSVAKDNTNRYSIGLVLYLFGRLRQENAERFVNY